MGNMIGKADAPLVVAAAEGLLHRQYNALNCCRGILDELGFTVPGLTESKRTTLAREDGRNLGRLIMRMADTGTVHGAGEFLDAVEQGLTPIVEDRIRRVKAMKKRKR